jgi:2-oxoglutarate/2-oxoacid ferredoxin oxidoreductase subunit beta
MGARCRLPAAFPFPGRTCMCSSFGGDGDAFSIGGNHFNHTARKNIKMTYVVMDNWVYGLTKKQTSPTSPLGFKSKTDQWGAVDYPINPMKQAISAGATFVARTTSTNPNHVLQMMEAAMDHDGFSFIECLSECVEFYEGAFDAANPAQRRRVQRKSRRTTT